MTPPTLHELAGIFMLALATALLIAHPSAESHARPAAIETFPSVIAAPTPIDGIETFATPETPQR